MSLQRARSVDEYVDWIRQARFELDDLRDCLEYASEDPAAPPVFLEPLASGIQALYDAMRAGQYVFGREDLPFMALADRFADAIPFHTLLKQINETHRRGLAIAGDDA